MEITKTKEYTKIILPPCFELSDTLECGQCFRFFKEQDGKYLIIAGGRFVRAKQEDGALYLFGDRDTEFWIKYFDLERDYQSIYKKIKSNEILSKSADAAKGIRILRQDFFETLCCFIFSQNNNIPRIKKITAKFCECFGEELSDGIYDFPTAARIAGCDISELAPLRCGFRDKYILSAARAVESGEVTAQRLSALSYEEARELLKTVKGVGNKVADCVLLYGCGRLESFPRDVWINRIMAEIMPDGLPSELENVGGIAQQYLFHYGRNLSAKSD